MNNECFSTYLLACLVNYENSLFIKLMYITIIIIPSLTILRDVFTTKCIW